MRPIDRIDKFTAALNYIWKTKCSDWRFGQIVENVFGDISEYQFWRMEEDKALELLCDYFDVNLKEIS